jgi:hypothetical protein
LDYRRNRSKYFIESHVRHDLVDNHVCHSNIHLSSMTYVCTIKVTQLALENTLHLVYTRVVPHLNHTVVDLSIVHLLKNIVCLDTTLATLLRLAVVIELLSVRLSI